MKHKTSSAYMIFVFFCFIAFLYLAKDKIDLLLHSQIEEATITSCESVSNERMGTNLSRRHFLSYRQVAETEAGEIADGFPFIASKEVCENSIGKKVSVFISEYIDVPSQINTFFNFWLLPYLGFYLLFVLVVAGIRGRAPLSANFLLLLGVALYYFEFS